jgi:hypothetical protein
MTDIPESHQIIWQYKLHEENIFYQRLNIFLVAESMLFVAFATLAATPKPGRTGADTRRSQGQGWPGWGRVTKVRSVDSDPSCFTGQLSATPGRLDRPPSAEQGRGSSLTRRRRRPVRNVPGMPG